MSFKEVLPATGRSIPIEFRLFEISLAITLVIFYFYTIYGLFFGYEWPVVTIYAAGSAFYTCLYISQKKGFPFRALTLIYYFAAFIFLALAWLPSGGIRGAITNMFVLIFVSGLLILHPRDFLIFAIASLTLVGIYLLLENTHPFAAAPYVDERQWMLDISVSNMIMFSVLGFTIFIFKKEYLQDKEKLKVTNQKLEQEKVKVEAAGKAKSMFLANISHEMRTPLNGITGSTELLMQAEMPENQRKILANLTYSKDLLNSLISDVLDMTMMESRPLEIQEKEFNLSALMESVMDIVHGKTTQVKKNICLSCTIEESVPPILIGDEERLRRVAVHLMNNAFKFTSHGSIKISISRIATSGHIMTVRFEVEDTGSGISEKNQKHLFEPFQYISREEGNNGIGLGLNICRKLVEAMGGEMGFTTQVGKGSLFYFQVPLKWQPKEPSGSENLCLKKLKVLIAEDQHINQVITKKMLQNIGVRDIDVAENGLEAIAKSEAKDYDLILMDLRMPLINGIEATQEILQKSKDHTPVVIAVTANALEIDKERCMRVGMLDFINKPFTKERLQKSIQQVMKQQGLESNVGASVKPVA